MKYHLSAYPIQLLGLVVGALAAACDARALWCGLSVQSKKIRGMETLVEKHQQLIKHMRLYEKFLRWAKK
jgi:hypothetical protein